MRCSNAVALSLGCACAAFVGCNGGTLDAGWNHGDDSARLDTSPTTAAPDTGSVNTNAPNAPDAGGGSAGVPDASLPIDAGADEPPALSPIDAGADEPPGLLPVGANNPLILSNDGPFDNWQGEYAFLLAQSSGPPLVGIVVGTARPWPDLAANLSGWQDMIARARDSGLQNIPDPIASDAPPLQRPTDGEIASTVPNDSDGARFIIEKSLELAQPDLPVVVATGGSLTDVADAYLLDPTVAERVVVVASLGSGFSETEQIAHMGVPNGEIDTWADVIVVENFRYIQVSAYYEHVQDVPAERLSELPDNPFGEWMAEKQPGLWMNPVTGDQVAVIALAMPEFTLSVAPVSLLAWDPERPSLGPDSKSRALLVTASDGTVARTRLWELLDDPTTWSP